MKVLVLWTLRGRTVVEIPDDTPEEDWGEAIEEPMCDCSTEEWQWDSDGYEIVSIEVYSGKAHQ